MYLLNLFLSKNRSFYQNKITFDLRYYITNDFRIIANNLLIVEERYKSLLKDIDSKNIHFIEDLLFPVQIPVKSKFGRPGDPVRPEPKNKSQRISSFNLHNFPVNLRDQIQKTLVRNQESRQRRSTRGEYQFINVKFPRHLIIDDVNEHHKLAYIEKQRKSSLLKFFWYFLLRILYSKFEYIMFCTLFVAAIWGSLTQK